MEAALLQIKGTEDTPEVNYSPELKHFVISGRSLPEDVTSFYAPVFNWFEENATEASGLSVFKFKLEYFNTASSKIILDILMRLEDLQNEVKGKAIVEWHYMDGDDDMQEAGEEYKELVELPFNLIAY